jgi:hypothetical protein
MDVRIFPNAHAVDAFAAREITALIQARAAGGKLCVLAWLPVSRPLRFIGP